MASSTVVARPSPPRAGPGTPRRARARADRWSGDPAPSARRVLRAGLLVLWAAVLFGAWRAGAVPGALAVVVAVVAGAGITAATRTPRAPEEGLPVVPIDLAARLASETLRR